MQSWNPFLDFANNIIGRYNEFHTNFQEAPMSHLETAETDAKNETPLPSTTNYFYHVQNIREENYLYEQKLTFLTNVLEQRFEKNLFPSLEKEIRSELEHTELELSDEMLQSITDRILDLLQKEPDTESLHLDDLMELYKDEKASKPDPELTGRISELEKRILQLNRQMQVQTQPQTGVLVPVEEDGKTVYHMESRVIVPVETVMNAGRSAGTPLETSNTARQGRLQGSVELANPASANKGDAGFPSDSEDASNQRVLPKTFTADNLSDFRQSTQMNRSIGEEVLDAAKTHPSFEGAADLSYLQDRESDFESEAEQTRERIPEKRERDASGDKGTNQSSDQSLSQSGPSADLTGRENSSARNVPADSTGNSPAGRSDIGTNNSSASHSANRNSLTGSDNSPASARDRQILVERVEHIAQKILLETLQSGALPQNQDQTEEILTRVIEKRISGHLSREHLMFLENSQEIIHNTTTKIVKNGIKNSYVLNEQDVQTAPASPKDFEMWLQNRYLGDGEAPSPATEETFPESNQGIGVTPGMTAATSLGEVYTREFQGANLVYDETGIQSDMSDDTAFDGAGRRQKASDSAKRGNEAEERSQVNQSSSQNRAARDIAPELVHSPSNRQGMGEGSAETQNIEAIGLESGRGSSNTHQSGSATASASEPGLTGAGRTEMGINGPDNAGRSVTGDLSQNRNVPQPSSTGRNDGATETDATAILGAADGDGSASSKAKALFTKELLQEIEAGKANADNLLQGQESGKNAPFKGDAPSMVYLQEQADATTDGTGLATQDRASAADHSFQNTNTDSTGSSNDNRQMYSPQENVASAHNPQNRNTTGQQSGGRPAGQGSEALAEASMELPKGSFAPLSDKTRNYLDRLAKQDGQTGDGAVDMQQLIVESKGDFKKVADKLTLLMLDSVEDMSDVLPGNAPALNIRTAPGAVAHRAYATSQISQVYLEYLQGDIGESQASDRIEEIASQYQQVYETEMVNHLSHHPELLGVQGGQISPADIELALTGQGAGTDGASALISGIPARFAVKKGNSKSASSGQELEMAVLVYGQDEKVAGEEFAQKAKELSTKVNTIQENIENIQRQNNVSRNDLVKQQREITKQIMKDQGSVMDSPEVQNRIREAVKAGVQKQMDEAVNTISKQVYHRLESRLKVERGRRGI